MSAEARPTPNPVRHVAVVDIGKTHAKVVHVDLESLTETGVRKSPNPVSLRDIYPCHDTDALWSFILDGLADLGRTQPVDAICVTTHGATAALLDREGKLALPVLDYEHPGPDSSAASYDAVRPAFPETGSPRLPAGLNLGAQLFWQQALFPDRFAEAASIVTYPQYWSFRLSGIAANEMTSLGCHTDLWNPAAGDYSSLVDRMGWRQLMAPVRPARDRLGPILPAVAERTRFPPATPVFCGIHDSNASLVPHLVACRPPFCVVSTGTWVIAMAVGGSVQRLDPARDTLVNVSVDGEPVPSARFMGGREYAMITDGHDAAFTGDDVAAVLEGGLFLLPSVQQGSGPYPHRKHEWLAEIDVTPARRQVAASFYLAVMTATCLDLIAADGETIVEGPFAGNDLFLGMLASATGRPVQAGASSGTGTSLGAALSAARSSEPRNIGKGRLTSPNPAWAKYARRWADEVGGG